MELHSRYSHFNNQLGRPKTGPELSALRAAKMEPKTTAVLDQFRKSDSAGSSSSSASFAVSTSLSSVSASSDTSSETGRRRKSGELKSLSGRPIVSNSRVRKDEKYRRDMYLAFIDNAIIQKARGVNEHYDDLVRQFTPESSPSTSQNPQQPPLLQQQQLRSYLQALSHVVSKLDRSHIVLLDAIVSMPWTVMDSAFVKAYISFVSMLVSARPEYLTMVLERAAQNLTYHSAKRALDLGFAESSSAPLTRRLVYERVHALVAQLLDLVPTLPSALYPLLARNFPHKRQNEAEHVTYIRNLLQLSDYCPELWDRILGLIMDRTLQIDVEIQVEMEDLDAEEDVEEVFQLDPFDTVIGQEGEQDDSDSESEEGVGDDFSDLSSDDGGAGSDAEVVEQPLNVKHVKEMVSKLDGVLEVIFKHLDGLHKTIVYPSAEDSSKPDDSTTSDQAIELPQQAKALPESDSKRQALSEHHFHSLLSIFERTILRTFKSRYTQFIVFWYSSLDNQFRDRFLGSVVSTALLDPSQPAVTRAVAASYVASYVSRASFVAREEAQMVVGVLCQFLESHLEEFESWTKQSAASKLAVPAQSVEQHIVFFAVVQAVFLIFCFRWRDLTVKAEDDDEEEEVSPHRVWMPQLQVMQRVVTSALNPLKVCSASVVQQFARVAQRVGFVYCFSIIEANKRAEFSPDKTKSASNNTTTLAASHQFNAELTTFFPFDPYKLPRSCSYIEGIYRDWTSVAIADSDEEDDDDDDEEVLADDEGAPGVVESQVTLDVPIPSSLDDAYMHGPTSFVNSPEYLGKSFGGMSISPSRVQPLDAEAS